MYKHKKDILLEKGWQEEEIKKAEAELDRSEHHDIFFSRMVFWSSMIVIVFANLLVSLVLIPFLIVFNNWILFPIIILLAGSIGFLYNLLITDVNHLETRHHLLAGILIPLIALTNMMLMVWVSNRFISDLNVQNQQHNLWAIAITFAVVLIIPAIIDKIRLHFKEKNAVNNVRR